MADNVLKTENELPSTRLLIPDTTLEITVFPHTLPLAFVCEGLEYASFTPSLFTSGVREFNTTTGYVTIRNASTGISTLYGDGTGPIVTASLDSASYCVWSSDAAQEPSGVMTVFWTDYPLDAYNLVGLTSVYYLRLTLSGSLLGTLDLTENLGLGVVEILGAAGIDTVLLPPTNNIEWFDCNVSVVTNTDDIINHFNPLIAGGFATFPIGCAPRTAASDVVYNACIANFWTILGV